MAAKYPFELRPLPEEDGGGWLITYPDLPGCMSDGATQEEAIKNGEDALEGWIRSAKRFGDPVPEPGESSGGKIITRIPRSLHTRLQARAKQEGVSMNMLVATMIAEGLGKRDHA
jgi:antitoxin HicB